MLIHYLINIKILLTFKKAVIQEYMSSIGHYEFGEDHKPFLAVIMIIILIL